MMNNIGEGTLKDRLQLLSSEETLETVNQWIQLAEYMFTSTNNAMKLLTQQEAAEFLGISVQTLKSMMQFHTDFPRVTTGVKGSIRIPLGELFRWVMEHGKNWAQYESMATLFA